MSLQPSFDVLSTATVSDSLLCRMCSFRNIIELDCYLANLEMPKKSVLADVRETLSEH